MRGKNVSGCGEKLVTRRRGGAEARRRWLWERLPEISTSIKTVNLSKKPKNLVRIRPG